MTAYVLTGLVQAKATGYDVEEARIVRARKWLLAEFSESTEVKTDLRAYMAYALVMSGSDSNLTVVDSVWNQRATLTSYGKALLGLAMAQINDPRANDLAKQLSSEAKQDDSASLVAHRYQLPDGLLRRHHAASYGVRGQAAQSGRSAECAACPRRRCIS